MQTQRVKDDIRPLALKTYVCALWIQKNSSDHDDITFYILLDILSLFAMRTM